MFAYYLLAIGEKNIMNMKLKVECLNCQGKENMSVVAM